jgi:hypothetical protein
MEAHITMDCMEGEQCLDLGGNPCTNPRPINIQRSIYLQFDQRLHNYIKLK